MAIDVFLDSNVWNLLYVLKIDLAVELPRNEFRLFITREAELEIPPIPTDKAELKAFIEKTIRDSSIETHSFFGFYDGNHPPEEQRVGGFGVGHWASPEELRFIAQQKKRLGEQKKSTTRLYKNEADVSLAARSFTAVVLTLDKRGPLKDAVEQGGKVVFLTDFESSGMSLGNFIRSAL